MVQMKNKLITVRMNLEWTFNGRDWSDEKELRDSLVNDPNIVLGYDVVHSILVLNDLSRPEVKKMTVKQV